MDWVPGVARSELFVRVGIQGSLYLCTATRARGFPKLSRVRPAVSALVTARHYA